MNLSDINNKIDAMDGYFEKVDQFIFDFLLDFQVKESFTGHLGEIGVYFGKTLCKLAQYTNDNENLFGIDKNFGIENQKTSILNGIKRVSNMSLKQLHCVCADSSYIIPTGQIDSIQTFNTFKFVHLDGCMAGHNIYKDIETADSWLNQNGILVINNWNNSFYPDIQKALYRYTTLNPNSFELFIVSDNKAYLCRPTSHSYFLYKAHELKTFFEDNKVETKIYETLNTLTNRTLIITNKPITFENDEAYFAI